MIEVHQKRIKYEGILNNLLRPLKRGFIIFALAQIAFFYAISTIKISVSNSTTSTWPTENKSSKMDYFLFQWNKFSNPCVVNELKIRNVIRNRYSQGENQTPRPQTLHLKVY